MNVAVYDGNKVKELRKRIAELEEESVGLVRELSLKYEEYDVLNEEVLKLREQVRRCKNENFNLKYNNSNNINDYSQVKGEMTQEEMDFMTLQSKVNEFGETLRMLQMSYDTVIRENAEKIEQMEMKYKSDLNKLTQENNALKRRLNTIDEMERKIKSGDISIKDIYSFTGSVGTTTTSNNNYNSSSDNGSNTYNKYKSNHKKDNYNYSRNIQRLNSNDDVIPPYDEVQSDINKLRESIQNIE